jgi:GT2 family glycosyltransferase
MNSAKVSIIIVNFNGGELLTECVSSALKSTLPVQVLISDNGSSDNSIQFLQHQMQDDRLHIHSNHANLGFAAGANSILPYATGDYLLFLNPDCLIQQDTVKRIVAEMDKRPDVGMSGCLILNLDGSEQAGCRRRVPTPWRTLVRIFHLDKFFPRHSKFQNVIMHRLALPEQPEFMEAISGAFMLVRRQALEDVGLMDEKYFLHCEDLDWCMRFRSKGWKILFVPNIGVKHLKGTCSKDRPVRVEWYKHMGMIRFYRKFFRHQYPLPVMIAVVCAVWVRFIIISVFLICKRPAL